MSIWVWLFSLLVGSATVIALFAGFFALDPEQIEKPQIVQNRPIPIRLPPKPAEPPLPPTPDSSKTNALSDLAPQSSSQAPDMGGVGFSGGGSGPAIAGGGGFGSNPNALVRDQSAAVRPPRSVVKSSPEYPSDARSRGVSGFVVLRIKVAANGSVEDIKVEQSEPNGLFDGAAMKAVRSWRFEPAIAKGVTVAAWTTQRIKFELN